MQNDKKTIGELIECEVRKQQIPITEFARQICCQRNNVYDIFRRSKMDITQLKQISKVLGRNFFKELAEDTDLINDEEETEEENMRQRAVSQFFKVVPDILREMGKPSPIVFAKLEGEKEDCPTPDFGLSEYRITFTIGRTLKDLFGECKALPIVRVADDKGHEVEVCTNLIYPSMFVNVELDYKTRDEWREVLKLTFDTYERFQRRLYERR